MTDTNNTLVTFLLDRTGSMESIKDDTIGAFNAYLDTLQKGGEGIEFTLLQFDSMSTDKLHVAVPVAKVPFLTNATFVPRASTPLIDAAVKTIKAVDESLGKRSDKPKVVVCIQTDGHENASTQHTWAELNAIIKEKTETGWQFVFMGAGIDAYQQGQKMGISAESTVSYDSSNRKATLASFRATAVNTQAFAHGRSANVSYSANQKLDAGDKFIPPDASKPPVKPKPKQQPVAVDDFSL